MFTWKHPKYYAELKKLRAQASKLTSAQAPGDKPASLPSKAQASSQKSQAPRSVSQGTSVPSPYPGHKQQE
jgi:hypothetical protein